MRMNQMSGGTLSSAMVDGQEVTLGDYVGFKADVEQGGEIVKITKGYGGVELTLHSEGGFHGEYIGGDNYTTQLASDCWVD